MQSPPENEFEELSLNKDINLPLSHAYMYSMQERSKGSI
jgi:hypothetical protein